MCNVWLQGKDSHYAFVASAGAYKPNKVEPALTESDARKDSAGHVAVEKYLEEQVMPREFHLPSPQPRNTKCHGSQSASSAVCACSIAFNTECTAACQDCLTMQLSFA